MTRKQAHQAEIAAWGRAVAEGRVVKLTETTLTACPTVEDAITLVNIARLAGNVDAYRVGVTADA